MKFKYINKKLFIVLVSGLILTGCGKSDLEIKDNSKTPEVTQEPTATPDATVTPVPTVTPTPEVIYTEKDNIVINAFTDLKDNIDELLNSETATNIKDKTKSVFITVVDFIFCDGEIKGVKFNDLTDAGKEKVLSISNYIDEKIESKFPDYKETIADGTKKVFNKASELIKKGASNVKDFTKEKLSTEHYESLANASEEIKKYTKISWDFLKDFTISTFDKGKEYIKTWYNNFKN